MSDELIYFHPDELRTREFNTFVDRLMETGTVDESVWADLTVAQRQVYSVINRAMKRYERKSGMMDGDIIR